MVGRKGKKERDRGLWRSCHCLLNHPPGFWTSHLFQTEGGGGRGKERSSQTDELPKRLPPSPLSVMYKAPTLPFPPFFLSLPLLQTGVGRVGEKEKEEEEEAIRRNGEGLREGGGGWRGGLREQQLDRRRSEWLWKRRRRKVAEPPPPLPTLVARIWSPNKVFADA